MRERYEDALERIRLIPAERTTAEPYCRFFRETAEYLLVLDHWYRRFAEADILTTGDIAGLMEMNAALYTPLLPGGRMAEWLEGKVCDGQDGLSGHAGTRQPSCREARMTMGAPAAKLPLIPLCSALLRELTALIPAVYEKREDRITAALELFIQVYCLYEEAFAAAKPLTRSPLRHPLGARQPSCRSAQRMIPCEKTVHDAFYSYFYDYSEEMQEELLRECFDPGGSYLQRYLLTADFSSADALYRSGEYVSPAQLQRFAALQQLSAAEIEAQLLPWRQVVGDGMAQIRQQADDRKPYVQLLGTPGRERLYQAFARSLRAEGIGITMPRAARGILMAVPEKRPGYYESANPQTDWVHDYDLSLLMGDRLTSRLLEERRHLLTALTREGNVCIAVVQSVPQTTAPAVEAEAEAEASRLRFTEHQDTVYRDYCRKAEALTRAALMGNETAEEAEHEKTSF